LQRRHEADPSHCGQKVSNPCGIWRDHRKDLPQLHLHALTEVGVLSSELQQGLGCRFMFSISARARGMQGDLAERAHGAASRAPVRAHQQGRKLRDACGPGLLGAREFGDVCLRVGVRVRL